MRFLLDTNILIPLEDSQIPLQTSLANFVRLAHGNGHQLIYHPATEDDVRRDANEARRRETLARLHQYHRLEERVACPWNTPEANPNDASDNEILYALQCEAAHALVTEDRGIHDKARGRGLERRVYTIQTAEDWLRRLHEVVGVELPNVDDVPLYSLTAYLEGEFFNSLRDGYPEFNDWFREKAREERRAWVSWEEPGRLGAICIYACQTDEQVTQEGLVLPGKALKLCTFKVGPTVRGRKVGELFLKSAFRYATLNRIEHIFVHGDLDLQHFLFALLEDFGFVYRGVDMNGRDAVYVKEHPVAAPEPNLAPFEYLRRYFPHFRTDPAVGKFIVPIQPRYHRILFPDYPARQRELFAQRVENPAGNAIKLAYLCHAPTSTIASGDVVLFYRSEDEKAITSVGVVEEYQALRDPAEIARLVSRRTVYTMTEIQHMAAQETKVMLFRLVRHVARTAGRAWLSSNGIVSGSIQSIRRIDQDAFERVLAYAG